MQAVKLIYIDEAGNTGTKADPNQPYHMLGTLIVDETQVRPAEMAVRDIAHRYLPAGRGTADIELHGQHIRGGKGVFRTMPIDQRKQLMLDLLDVLLAHDIGFGYVAIDKAKHLGRSSKHPHEIAFLILVEQIQDILEKQGAFGLLIADQQDEVEDRLINNLDHYKQHATNWGYRRVPIDRVVDSIHFVKSRNNWLIQLADIATFATYRGIRTDEDLFSRWQQETGADRNYHRWRQHNATPAQALDLALSNRIVLRRFARRYPQ
ncbi:MAG: hypothetical protein RLY86_3968 [Pseudomonadota bacterium]|jgi:hypothetical protein